MASSATLDCILSSSEEENAGSSKKCNKEETYGWSKET